MAVPRKNRSEAKARGLKRYIGRPCKYGHSGERYTRSAECCECKRIGFAEWTKANRENYNAYVRCRYHALPAETLAKSRKRFAKERKIWERANPEKVKALKKEYRLANMDRWRSYIRNRRARLAGASGTHDHNDIQHLRVRQNDRCAHCSVDLHGCGDVDHKTPLIRGGSNWPHNLQLLCGTCNRRKHAKDPVEHARAIGLLPNTADAIAAKIAQT